MTAFMTAFPVILFQPTCPGDQRALHIWVIQAAQTSVPDLPHAALLHVKWADKRCPVPVDLSPLPRESQNSGLALFLSSERSEAMLYAPLSSDVKENCKMISLRCYMSELTMVIAEEEIQDPKTHIFFDFKEKLPTDHPVDCPPCEAYSLKNITVFLERLISLLQEMNSRTT